LYVLKVKKVTLATIRQITEKTMKALCAFIFACLAAAQDTQANREPALVNVSPASNRQFLPLLDIYVPCSDCASLDPTTDSAMTTSLGNATLDDLPVLDLSSSNPDQQTRINWGGLAKSSSMYLGIMHSYRIATEPSTRKALHNSVFGGYFKALGSMHGWSDGDGYYENYLGHPMEGAVSGYLWIHNDPRYRTVEFGGSRDYWMSRLRAYAAAWAFSAQFEVGLMSEAAIGQIQRYCCAYGFVDHVITPNIGMVWLVGGDILDRYVGRKIEDHTRNATIRAIALAGLNPPLSFANVLGFRYPWHRENRPGVHDYQGELYYRKPTRSDSELLPLVPKLEITAVLPSVTRYGNLYCYGGSAVAGFRISERWQWTGEVGGCTLGNDLPKGWSGDSLVFMTGPQWIKHSQSKWSPHFHFRVGGQKVTEDYCLEYAAIGGGVTDGTPCKSDPTGYVRHYEATGPALSLGSGIDVRLNRIFEVRIANLEYVHSWMGKVHGSDFNQGLRFTMGVGLKIGTW
jgi:hypothetical protein